MQVPTQAQGPEDPEGQMSIVPKHIFVCDGCGERVEKEGDSSHAEFPIGWLRVQDFHSEISIDVCRKCAGPFVEGALATASEQRRKPR